MFRGEKRRGGVWVCLFVFLSGEGSVWASSAGAEGRCPRKPLRPVSDLSQPVVVNTFPRQRQFPVIQSQPLYGDPRQEQSRPSIPVVFADDGEPRRDGEAYEKRIEKKARRKIDVFEKELEGKIDRMIKEMKERELERIRQNDERTFKEDTEKLENILGGMKRPEKRERGVENW
ncbi:MAG: putative clathrin light chain [Amphiamblys sp. WSBS2006]|nr:MAG: putative clathrin light chain [Amphiamblys sp. WSBS2006]